MSWTKYPPKVPGWYWLRSKQRREPRVSQLRYIPYRGDGLYFNSCSSLRPITDTRDIEWWSEPIPEPAR